MGKVIKIKPFTVISNETQYVYDINKVEVDGKGKIIGYIIQNQCWKPDRFRGTRPKFINSVTLEPLDLPEYNVEDIIDELYDMEEYLGKITKRVQTLLADLEKICDIEMEED